MLSRTIEFTNIKWLSLKWKKSSIISIGFYWHEVRDNIWGKNFCVEFSNFILKFFLENTTFPICHFLTTWLTFEQFLISYQTFYNSLTTKDAIFIIINFIFLPANTYIYSLGQLMRSLARPSSIFHQQFQQLFVRNIKLPVEMRGELSIN